MHKRRDKQAENNGNNDDGKAPVPTEIVEELDDIKYQVFKCVPHKAFSFLYTKEAQSTLFKEQDHNHEDLLGDTLKSVSWLTSGLSKTHNA